MLICQCDNTSGTKISWVSIEIKLLSFRIHYLHRLKHEYKLVSVSCQNSFHETNWVRLKTKFCVFLISFRIFHSENCELIIEIDWSSWIMPEKWCLISMNRNLSCWKFYSIQKRISIEKEERWAVMKRFSSDSFYHFCLEFRRTKLTWICCSSKNDVSCVKAENYSRMIRPVNILVQLNGNRWRKQERLCDQVWTLTSHRTFFVSICQTHLVE